MKINIKLIIGFLFLHLFALESFAQGFKLPWDNGTSYYVSRTATPAPTGAVGSTCGPNSAYNGFNPHAYIAIDFDSPNGVHDNVRASKAGKVVHSGPNGGYGNLVRIRHSDNTQTYYAHNDVIYVPLNREVQQGCVIADGGNTGNSFGDHIHFEWRDVGGVAFSDKRYPTFTECGCKVKAKYCYKSTNTNGSCTATPCTPPVNDNCSAATSITSNGPILNGTVKCATGSLGANQCTGCNCTSPDDLDVYYKFVAQATTHTVTLSDYASNFDGVIELRSGCGAGTNLGCYDPSGTPSTVSKAFTGLTVGQMYYVRVFEWDNIGTPPSSPVFKLKVTHNCPKPANIASITGSSTACSSTSKTYSVAPVSGATSYTWTLPSGWTGSSTTASITTTVGSASGDIKVKANNACGSSNLQTKAVTVSASPGVLGAISGNTTACQSSAQSYAVTPVSGVTSYTWTLPSGWTGSSTSATINATAGSGSGQVTVKGNSSCGNTAVKTMQVNVVSLDKTVSVLNSELTSNATGVTYQWIDCATNQPFNGATGKVFNAPQNGKYAVVITKGNCVETSECIQVTALGLTFIDKSINLVAYPNPTSNQIRLTASGLVNEKHRIVFTNVKGQVLIDKEFTIDNQALDIEFDMRNFANGMYFMAIRSRSLNHVFKIEKL